MAALGAIGHHRKTAYRKALSIWAASAAQSTPKHNLIAFRRRQNVWRFNDVVGLKYTNIGTLSGHVYEGGVPVQKCIVRVHYRPTGHVIAQTRTDSAGAFAFEDVGLDPNHIGSCYCVALDNDGGTSYNAIIYDKLTPYIEPSDVTVSPAGLASLAVGTPIVSTIPPSAFDPAYKSSYVTLSNSDLTASATNGLSCVVRGTLGRTTGKYYFEFLIDQMSGAYLPFLGVCNASLTNFSALLGETANGWALRTLGSGGAYNNNVPNTAYNTTCSNGDVIMVAVDLDASKLWFGKNGTWMVSGNPAAGTGAVFSNLTGTIYPAAVVGYISTVTLRRNIAEFAWSIPSGFNAWG